MYMYRRIYLTANFDWNLIQMGVVCKSQAEHWAEVDFFNELLCRSEWDPELFSFTRCYTKKLAPAKYESQHRKNNHRFLIVDYKKIFSNQFVPSRKLFARSLSKAFVSWILC